MQLLTFGDFPYDQSLEPSCQGSLNAVFRQNLAGLKSLSGHFQSITFNVLANARGAGALLPGLSISYFLYLLLATG
jgi:hypothetical protein